MKSSNSNGVYVAAMVLAFVSWPFLSFIAKNLGDFPDYRTVVAAWGLCVALIGGIAVIVPRIVEAPGRRRAWVNVAAVGFALFFVFGALDYVLKSNFDVERFRWVGLVWASGVGACLVVTWRASRHRHSTTVLCFVGGAMVLAAATDIAFGLADRYSANGSDVARPAITAAKPGQYRPNVYYFILDGYARADALSAGTRLDNTAFLDELEGHGFWISEESSANYPATFLSVAATLNMDYLVAPGVGALDGFVRYQVILAGHNETTRLFRSLGYTYVHVPPGGWAGTECRGVEDVCIHAKSRGLNETQIALLAMTPLEVVIRKLRPAWLRFKQMEMPQAMEGIREVRERTRTPLFVLTHLLIPHETIYDAECRRRAGRHRIADALSADRVVLYNDTVRCLNAQILDALPRLISSDPDAIVIFQSDHGIAFDGLFEKPFEQWREEEKHWRFGILNAIRAPERCRRHLYPRISSVNTFRFVRACLAGDAPDYLPDLRYLVRYGDPDVILWNPAR